MFPRLLLSALALTLLALPAQAENLKFFSSVITAPSTQFYFILPSEPDPTAIDPATASFTIGDTTLYAYDSQAGFYPVPEDITFYDLSQGGGFSITRGYTGFGIRYFGSQLFSGTLADPIFSPAVFTLQNNFFPNESTLTITSMSVVPEPASWLMMIVGFGAAGHWLRGLRRQQGGAAA